MFFHWHVCRSFCSVWWLLRFLCTLYSSSRYSLPIKWSLPILCRHCCHPPFWKLFTVAATIFLLNRPDLHRPHKWTLGSLEVHVWRPRWMSNQFFSDAIAIDQIPLNFAIQASHMGGFCLVASTMLQRISLWLVWGQSYKICSQGLSHDNSDWWLSVISKW